MSELPSGWLSVSLGDVGTLYCGQSPSVAEVNTVGEGTLYVTGPEQWDGQQIHRTKWTTNPKRPVPDGCIFITVKGAGVGKLFPGTACAIGRDVYAYLPHPEIEPAFALQALKRNINEVVAQARGDIPGLSKDHILDQLVGFPPLAEQRRIVEKLDALTARTARARADLDRIPALAARYKQAVLAKAFSGELTQTSSLDWKEATIEQIASVGTGSTPKKSNTHYYKDGTIPWVTSSVVNQSHVDKAEDYITEIAIKETNCKIFPPGTLLVAMYGEGKTRGGVTTLRIHAATNQALAAINVTDRDRVSSRYLYWFLKSQYLQLRTAAAGGVQPNLNLGIIKATSLPLPPKRDQGQIVDLVERAFADIDRMVTEATAARRLLDRLDQAVLAKAFRGELVPQDPSDEPASVLLDRIRAERAVAPKAKRGRRKAAA